MTLVNVHVHTFLQCHSGPGTGNRRVVLRAHEESPVGCINVNAPVCCRIYERLKAEKEAQLAAAEEQERLINLMRAEEEEERARQVAFI